VRGLDKMEKEGIHSSAVTNYENLLVNEVAQLN